MSNHSEIIKDLVKLANHLDSIKKTKEADYIDNLVKNAIFGDPMQCAIDTIMNKAYELMGKTKEDISQELANMVTECLTANTSLLPPKFPTKENMEACMKEKAESEGIDIAAGIGKNLFENIIAAIPLVTEDLVKCI